MINIVQKMSKTGVLTITIDTKKDFGPTKSGKSIMIASTQGNSPVDGLEGVTMGINVYRRNIS